MRTPFTFIHAADLHLDSPFRGLAGVPKAVQERLRQSTFAALDRLVALAKQEKADFLVVAGDLYDAADRSLKAQLRLQSAFEELCSEGIGVFVVHGNHDPLSGSRASLKWPASVVTFGSDEVKAVPATRRDGELVAHIYGISYSSPQVTDNWSLRFRRQEGAPFHLALLHGNVDGQPGYDNYAPCKLNDLTSSGFDYWALGHIHDRRVLHEYPHIVYPGNFQGRSVRETGPKGAYTVRVAESGDISLLFSDLADVLWMEQFVSIADLTSEQELKERLVAAAEAARRGANGRPVVLRLVLVGSGCFHALLTREPALANEWAQELRLWIGSPDERDDWVWIESLKIRTDADMEEGGFAYEEGFLGELFRLGTEAGATPDSACQLVEAALASMRAHPRLRRFAEERSDRELSELVNRGLQRALALLAIEQT